MAEFLGAAADRWQIVLVVVERDGGLVLVAEPTGSAVACSRCGELSRRRHSRYERRPLDLPWRGRTVRLRVHTRRWFCDAPSCSQKIFAERFDGALATSARRTDGGMSSPHSARLLTLPALASCTHSLKGRYASATWHLLVGVSESAVSHQLRFLRERRLVKPDRRGNVIAYALDDHHVGALFREAEYHADHVRQDLEVPRGGIRALPDSAVHVSAIALCGNAVERRYLERRLEEVS